MTTSARQLGFTLIEMMIVVTIMLFLFSAGLASYMKFNDNQVVLATGKQIQLMLRTAQKKARVGDKPSGCSILQGYQLSGSTAANAVVTLNAICNVSTLVAVETYTMPTDVTLASALSITFKVLTAGTDQPGTVTVQNSNSTNFSFTVGAGGDISEGTLTVP